MNYLCAMQKSIEKLMEDVELSKVRMDPMRKREAELYEVVSELLDRLESAEQELDGLLSSSEYVDALSALKKAEENLRSARVEETCRRIESAGYTARAEKTFWDHDGDRIQKGSFVTIKPEMLSDLVEGGIISAL